MVTEQIDEVLKGLTQIPEMTKVLRIGDTVTAITDREQAYLSDMLDADYMVQVSKGFVIGDRICITEGPLSNFQGSIKKINRHKQVADLEIDMFGRKTPVQVGLEVLAKMTEAEFLRMKEEHLSQEEDISSQTQDNTVSSEDMPTQAQESESSGQQETVPEKVRVIAGVFAGMTGEVLCENQNKQELKVSLNLFDQPATVTFSQDEVSRI